MDDAHVGQDGPTRGGDDGADRLRLRPKEQRVTCSVQSLVAVIDTFHGWLALRELLLTDAGADRPGASAPEYLFERLRLVARCHHGDGVWITRLVAVDPREG